MDKNCFFGMKRWKLSTYPCFFFLLLCNSLLYGAEDPSIAGMVLDSAFSNLFELMMELVDVYKIRLPKFTVWDILEQCSFNS